MRRTSALLGLALLASAACTDSNGGDPTSPFPPAGAAPAASITVSSGSDQRGFTEEALPNAITVIVRTASNAPVTGERVRFSVTAGDGTVQDSIVVSGSGGRAGTSWTLGASAGAQELSVSLASGGVPPVTVKALAISPAEADMLAISNAGAGSILALFIGYDGPDEYGYGQNPIRVEAQAFSVGNGLVRLLPREDSFADEDLVVFASGRPPAIVRTDWQPRPDTLFVSFTAAFRVGLTIWVMGDFAALSDRVQRDLNATSVLWASHPFGLVLGDVTINDASSQAQTSPSCTSVPFEDPTVINVYYSPIAATMGFAGYACSQRRILMRPVGLPGTSLLAHELGHTFGLGHVQDSDNFMHPVATGGRVTIGQIYRSHFSGWSALNAVYRFRPPEQLRCCAVSETFSP